MKGLGERTLARLNLLHNNWGNNISMGLGGTP